MENLYSKIGPETLSAIVDTFYDHVFENELIGHLFQTDKSLIRYKQYQFLTQFLGGPHLYSESYGHPRMRMRHLPHRIDQAAMEEWLKCMKSAINQNLEDEELANALYSSFPRLAQHMVNS
ncbi:MAG: globin [Fluviicola sp. XM-24bin1]|nr:MAG: globin [Fluviicola sp. XM-24bin1]